MRVTEVHNQILALLSDTVTNALNAQLLLEAFGNAYDHVVDQAAGQAVQCTVVLVVVRTSDEDFVALHRDVHVRMEFAGKGCLSALYGNNVAVNLDFNAGRNGNRHSTNSRHCLYLPYQTNARTSPPTFSSRAFLSVMTPLDVETMAIPRPRSTFGSSCAPAYTRRPGFDTRLMPVIAF